MTPQEQALEQQRHHLFNRQKAYQIVFNKESQLVKIVLEDLAKFCRSEDTCFNPDPRIHAALEGRREVYLRIMHHLNLESEPLAQKYIGDKK